MEARERRINSYLCRSVGLPRCLSSAALYSTSNVLKLPFKDLMAEFVISWRREFLWYRDSKEPKVVAEGIEVHIGRKWSAGSELSIAEGRLRQKTLVRIVATGHAGLGFFPST